MQPHDRASIFTETRGMLVINIAFIEIVRTFFLFNKLLKYNSHQSLCQNRNTLQGLDAIAESGVPLHYAEAEGSCCCKFIFYPLS